jgi:hypothetical protein
MPIRVGIVVMMLWWLTLAAPAQSWSLRVRGTVLEIFYSTGGSAPQYAALHLDSSYFRLNYGPGSSWGTSVILMPAFWSNGVYYQGAPVSWSHRLEGADLVLLLSGRIATLQVQLLCPKIWMVMGAWTMPTCLSCSFTSDRKASKKWAFGTPCS